MHIYMYICMGSVLQKSIYNYFKIKTFTLKIGISAIFGFCRVPTYKTSTTIWYPRHFLPSPRLQYFLHPPHDESAAYPEKQRAHIAQFIHREYIYTSII